MKLDLHTHSMYSPDALIKPSTAIKIAKKNNLILAITDHNTTKGWNDYLMEASKQKIEVILGEEIKVLDSDGKVCGELIGLFLNEEIKIMHFNQVIDSIKEQDGIVVSPHPFDSFRLGFKFIEKEFKKINLIEAFNARSQLNSFNKKAEKFAKEKNISMIASSDAHTPEEIGNGLTEVNALNLEEARKELLAGRTKLIKNKKANLWQHTQTQLIKKNLIKTR
jgi:predicted metal-dependent phosphoesterase TrpH